MDDQIRFSNSPRRYTQVIQSPTSPKRSLYPEHEESRATLPMESIYSQADLGHRTADFFEADSSDNEAGLVSGETVTEPIFDSRERPASPGKRKQPLPSAQSLVSQCKPASKRVTLQPDSPDSQGYHRLDSNLHEQVPHANRESTMSTSFNGSVEEMGLSQVASERAPQFPKPARLSGSSHTAQSTGRRWASDPQYVSRMSADSDKLGQRLGVHGVAYDLLLRGLLNDEELMRRAGLVEPLVNRLSGIRNSMIRQGLHLHNPRSPKDHLFQQGSLDIDRESQTEGANHKKVHVVPPPIDVESARRSLPTNMVRTPYPHDRIRRKDFGQQLSPDDEPLPSATTTESPQGLSESILTLSIHNKLRLTRITTLTIPASNEYSAIHNTKTHSPSFDDQEFFLQLRKAYKSLSGTLLRTFSARTLSHISVSRAATRAADAGYGWLHQPRFPRVLAYKGLTDTFSEEKILLHYRHPALGKSRYAFVQWAHRLSAAPLSPSPNTPSRDSELVRRVEQPEGLEFVMGWSIRRILLGLILVILLAVAAALLWILLGKNTVAALPAHGGFSDAGDRVGSGVLIGMCVLLVGLSCMAGWLGVSWLSL